eukprot:4178896-Amphidinium_carterae.1
MGADSRHSMLRAGVGAMPKRLEDFYSLVAFVIAPLTDGTVKSRSAIPGDQFRSPMRSEYYCYDTRCARLNDLMQVGQGGHTIDPACAALQLLRTGARCSNCALLKQQQITAGLQLMLD